MKTSYGVMRAHDGGKMKKERRGVPECVGECVAGPRLLHLKWSTSTLIPIQGHFLSLLMLCFCFCSLWIRERAECPRHSCLTHMLNVCLWVPAAGLCNNSCRGYESLSPLSWVKIPRGHGSWHICVPQLLDAGKNTVEPPGLRGK